MGIEKDLQIKELYNLKHRYDSKNHRHYPFEDNLLENTTSKYIWYNPNMNTYLTMLQSMVVLMVQKNDLVRNYFNFTVTKYWSDYWG